VDIYSRVRRACLKDGMSVRAAARYFNKDRKTIAKMLRHALPPGYRRSEAPRRPTLDGYVGVIDEILRTDKALIKKQWHTAKRIFERLRCQRRTKIAPYAGEKVHHLAGAGRSKSAPPCWM
jgi:transposase